MSDALKFDVDAELFMMVRRAVGSEETRYYLQGVFIEPDPRGGAWLVATDGIIMMVARDASAVAPKPAIIKLQLLEVPDEPDCECGAPVGGHDFTRKRLVFDLPEEGYAPAILVTPGLWRQSIGVIDPAPDAVKYPAWRKVWGDQYQCQPKHDAGGDAAKDVSVSVFHGGRLDRLIGGEAFQIIIPADHGPAVVLLNERANVAGLIAPYQGKIKGQELLAELRLAGTQAAAAPA